MNFTIEKLYADISRLTHHKVESINPETSLTQLVPESFVLIELMIELQEQYDILITQDEMMGIKTVGDLSLLLSSKLKS